MKRLAKQKAAPPPPAQPARKSKPAAAPAKPSRGDNPYLRPFGRLSLKELEQQISDTETALAECQQSFANAGSFKDPANSRKMQTQFDQLGKKLKQLESEYFTREK
jgi:hypothetical protein